MKYRFVKILLGIGILGFFWMLILMIRYSMGSPQVKVDYLAVINQPIMDRDESDKAWPIYRDVWIKYDFCGTTGHFMELYTLAGTGSIYREVLPSDGEAWEIACQKIAECDDLLEAFRIGGQKPILGVPFYDDINKYDPVDRRALFPQGHATASGFDSGKEIHVPTWNFRTVGHLLQVDTQRAIQQEDRTKIVRNLVAMFGISSQIVEVCSYSNVATAMQTQRRACDLIDEVIAAGIDLTDDELARIQLAASQCRIDEKMDFSYDRALFLDFVQRSFTDDGNGNGRITAAGIARLNNFFDLQANVKPVAPLGGPQQDLPSVRDHVSRWVRGAVPVAGTLTTATRKQVVDVATDLFDRASNLRVESAPLTGLSQLNQEVRSLHSAFECVKSFLPLFEHYGKMLVATKANRDSIVAALAVLRYQRQTGELPASLEELIGTYLEETPLDPIDGNPLRYKLQGDGFLIYSIGVDQVDDGGNSSLKASQYYPTNPTLGDWILWPRFSNR